MSQQTKLKSSGLSKRGKKHMQNLLCDVNAAASPGMVTLQKRTFPNKIKGQKRLLLISPSLCGASVSQQGLCSPRSLGNWVDRSSNSKPASTMPRQERGVVWPMWHTHEGVCALFFFSCFCFYLNFIIIGSTQKEREKHGEHAGDTGTQTRATASVLG